MHDRLVHVDDAVAPDLVIAKAVTAEHEVTRVADALLRAPLAHGERGERHEGFEGRARRIGAAQRAVEQRFVGRGVVGIPVDRVDAINKQVGVEPRATGERQHLAGGRLDRHHRALAVPQRFFGDALQLDVD